MTVLEWVLTGVAALGCLYWLGMAAVCLSTLRGLANLSRRPPRELESWPRLSLVIPACDEEEHLEEAMRTKLAQDYPELELVLVDDRSTDRTGAIVDRLAAEDDRVRAVHVTELPAGWLGKVHALHVGAEQASGEWLLFTDADVFLEPGALRRAVAHCEEQRLDHLAVLPFFIPSSFFLNAALVTFGRIVLAMARPRAIADERSDWGAGIGAFNLVRRSALERAGGLREIAYEVADDLALGRMLKAAGARPALAIGEGLARVQLYSSFQSMVDAIERVAVLLEFSLVRTVLFCAALIVVELSPFLGLFAFALPDLALAQGLAVAGSALAVLLGGALGARVRLPVLPSLLAPVGSIALVGATLRGGLVGWKRQALRWRGTEYPAEALLAGRRWGKV